MKRKLRVVGERDAQPTTGEAVLQDWVDMSANYFTRRLPELPEADPLRAELETLAARYCLLAVPIAALLC